LRRKGLAALGVGLGKLKLGDLQLLVALKHLRLKLLLELLAVLLQLHPALAFLAALLKILLELLATELQLFACETLPALEPLHVLCRTTLVRLHALLGKLTLLLQLSKAKTLARLLRSKHSRACRSALTDCTGWFVSVCHGLSLSEY
jgi:hypothetical protein